MGGNLMPNVLDYRRPIAFQQPRPPRYSVLGFIAFACAAASAGCILFTSVYWFRAGWIRTLQWLVPTIALPMFGLILSWFAELCPHTDKRFTRAAILLNSIILLALTVASAILL